MYKGKLKHALEFGPMDDSSGNQSQNFEKLFIRNDKNGDQLS